MVLRILPLLALALLVAGCNGRGSAGSEATAKPVSPLVGGWSLNSSSPGHSPKGDYPQFTALRFEPDGTLEASYATTGTLANATGSSPNTKDETDRWSVSGQKLTVVEGSRSLSYTYAIREGMLTLTPAGADQGVVYVKQQGGTASAAP